MIGDGQVVHDLHHAGDAAAAFDAHPPLLDRADFASQNGGVPEGGDVNALQIGNALAQAGQNSSIKVLPESRLACREVRWRGGRDDFRLLGRIQDDLSFGDELAAWFKTKTQIE